MNCAFSQFIEVYPDEGYLFRSSFHGQRIHMTYDDGEVYFDAYSTEPMRERGNTDLAVDIRYDGALSSGDSATGAGQYKPGETCVVVANATTPGRTFAYWADEQGNILSEDQWYEFTVERDTLLTAVFADKATVAPEVRLGSADGRQVIGAKASVLVDGRDMGTSFTTYSGKAVTLTCEYDASKYRLDHWESSLDKHYLGSRPGDTIEYEAVAGETPIAVLVEYGQVNVSAKSASGLALGTVSGSGHVRAGADRQAVGDSGEGVPLPGLDASRRAAVHRGVVRVSGPGLRRGDRLVRVRLLADVGGCARRVGAARSGQRLRCRYV